MRSSEVFSVTTVLFEIDRFAFLISRPPLYLDWKQLKLEKKRAEAAEKMQRAIKHAQKKADKKKVKEQVATKVQIDGVERALDKMSRTGRLPWSLAFL